MTGTSMATATPATGHSHGAGRTAGPMDATSRTPALRTVNGAARVDRLQNLIARIEQSPRSRQRDAVLSAARQRVVTVDTGAEDPSAWRSKPDDERVATVDMSSHSPSTWRFKPDDRCDSLALLEN